MRVGLIGATGWLGSALGAGLLARGILAPGELVLLNRSAPQPNYHGHADVTWARNAGAVGCATARQLAARGFRTLLVEREDFGAGA
ncbi:hypothetical protein [Paracoccus sp. pheM1]|uniref:hypothetical protein n=1 Tax=Paracoccus sp. pheM1 TaxID=2831675 RepID=UPI001F0AF76A|nr:hypothetical protein [Paracoccus sp. pheM1]